MLPLLPFAAGLLAGAVAIRLLRNAKTREGLDKVQDKARHGLEKTQDKLRDAAISGLAAVENSSSALKQRLSAAKADAPQDAPQPAASPAESVPPAAVAKAPRRKSTTVRKAGAKTPGADKAAKDKA